MRHGLYCFCFVLSKKQKGIGCFTRGRPFKNLRASSVLKNSVSSSKKSILIDTPLVIDSHPIEAVAEHKHLGIIFTPDLKWTTHIQVVIRNASAGLLRWMSHHLRGPLTTKLYLAYVRPTMEYASPLWHGSREEDPCRLQSPVASSKLRGTHTKASYSKLSTRHHSAGGVKLQVCVCSIAFLTFNKSH